MQAPDGKIAALAGFVIGMAISGMALLTPSGDTVTVQQIELRGNLAGPTAKPLSPAATDPTTPGPTAGGPSTSTGSPDPEPTVPDPEPTVPDPEPARTPIVVAPTVVSEWHTAPPRATPRPTPDDDADETEEPEATDAPEETEEPEATDEPDGTDEPGATDKPDGTDEPEATDAPGGPGG
jgi:hypothetical protein